MAGKRPTHRLKILDVDRDKNGTLGAGWLNADGSISVVVDPGCRVEYNPNFVYTLFPVERKED